MKDRMNRKEMDEEVVKMGFDGLRRLMKWRIYEVFYPFFKDGEVHCVGRPIFVLRSGLTYRFASEEEVRGILDSVPDD